MMMSVYEKKDVGRSTAVHAEQISLYNFIVLRKFSGQQLTTKHEIAPKMLKFEQFSAFYPTRHICRDNLRDSRYGKKTNKLAWCRYRINIASEIVSFSLSSFLLSSSILSYLFICSYEYFVFIFILFSHAFLSNTWLDIHKANLQWEKL